MWWMTLLAQLASAEPCTLEPTSDTFQVTGLPTDKPLVHLLIGVHLTVDNQKQAQALLSELEQRDLRATLLVAREHAEDLAPILQPLADKHEVALVLREGDVIEDAEEGPKALRKQVGRLKKAAGNPVDTVWAPLTSRLQEAVINRAGLRSVWVANGASTGKPRRALRFDGQVQIGYVVAPGPYTGSCGAQDGVAAFNTATADRVAQALFGAARAGSLQTVRLRFEDPKAGDSAMLAEWLDTVITPSSVVVGTAADVRTLALQQERNNAPTPQTETVGGRLVSVQSIRELADHLESTQNLPRTLPGNLTPTEAYYALLLHITEQHEGQVVRLLDLQGPPTQGERVTPDGTQIPAAAVKQLATRLVAELPEEVPAALSVDGKLLSADQLLHAYAAVTRGEDPITVRSAQSPEPNTRGLGWGESSTP